MKEVVRKNDVVVERACMRGGIYRYGSGCIHAWKVER